MTTDAKRIDPNASLTQEQVKLISAIELARSILTPEDLETSYRRLMGDASFLIQYDKCPTLRKVASSCPLFVQLAELNGLDEC